MTSPQRSRLREAAVLLALAALAGCGTTVQGAAGSPARSTSVDDGLGLGGTNGIEGSASTTGGHQAVGTSGQGPAGTTRGVAGGTPITGQVGGATSGVTLGTPTTKPIVIGITYVKDPAAGLQAIGVQGATFGDERAYAQALVNDLNARGGLGGRKVVPVLFEYNADPGSDPIPDQDQRACSTFTEDNHVDLAITQHSGSNLTACLQRRNVPMVIEGSIDGSSAKSLAAAPLFFQLGGFNLDRRAAEQVRALDRQRYFSKWDNANGGPSQVAPVKIGIVTYDNRDFAASASGPLASGIAALGFAKPEVVQVAFHDSYSNLTAMQSQLQGAVLKFKASGVTHVLVWDDNGVATLFFMQTAENQGYRPRYGVNTGNNMDLLTRLVKAEQLTGATGIGWYPDLDLPDSELPKHDNAGRRACHAKMAKAELTGGGYSPGHALEFCVPFAALEVQASVMARLTPATWVQGMEALGSGYSVPTVPAAWLGPGRHDGLAGVYDYRYDSPCDCMKYDGAVRPLQRP